MLALMAGMFAGGAGAETYVGAGLDDAGVGYDWNSTGSPYIVNKTIYVAAGETLTIGPGVTVLIDPGCQIIVDGTLIVGGNATHPVMFDANDTTARWSGIKMNESSIATIDHAIFSNASAAIEAYDCDITITNSRFINNGAIAPIYADFSKRGSIIVEGCYIEANSIETPEGEEPSEGAITIFIEAQAYGENNCVTAVSVIIVDNVINSTSDDCTIYVNRSVTAQDNATARIVGDILISGNTINEDAPESNQIHFVTNVDVHDNATGSIVGDITITENDLYTTSDNWDGMLFMERDVHACDKSSGAIVGDIIISGNIFNLTSSFTDFIFVSTEVESEGNATSEIVGNFSIVGNEMLQAGNDAAYFDFVVKASGYNSVACIVGDILLNDNIIENVVYGPYIYYMLDASGQGGVSVIGDTYMNGNEIGAASEDGVYYECLIYAGDSSTVSVDGDVYMDENWMDYSLTAFTAQWGTYGISDNATVNVAACLSIVGNHVVETQQAFDIIVGAYGDSAASQEAKVLFRGGNSHP